MRRIGRRRARQGEGRIAARLRELLAARGVAVAYFRFATGFWARADVYRWEAHGASLGTADTAGLPVGFRVHVGGWERMRDCIRGISLSHNSRDPAGAFEAYATE